MENYDKMFNKNIHLSIIAIIVAILACFEEDKVILRKNARHFISKGIHKKNGTFQEQANVYFLASRRAKNWKNYNYSFYR